MVFEEDFRSNVGRKVCTTDFQIRCTFKFQLWWKSTKLIILSRVFILAFVFGFIGHF